MDPQQFNIDKYEKGRERKNRCNNCKFWDLPATDAHMKYPNSDEHVVTGACKRYPPSFSSLITYFLKKKDLLPIHFSRYPITDQYDWCGEWQSNDSA